MRARLGLVFLCLAAAAACSDDKKDGPGDDDAPPLTIVQTLPAADAVDVAASTAAITVTFSQALDAASVPAQLLLARGDATLPVTYTVNGPLLTVTPGGALGYGSRCALTLPAGIRGAQGSELEADAILAFTTAITSGLAQTELAADDQLRRKTGDQIGVDAAGNVFALFSFDNDDIRVRRHAVSTGTWSPEATVVAGESATLSVSASGDALVAGREFSGPYRNWTSLYTSGGSWAMAEQVSTQADSEGPADIVLAAGTASAIFRGDLNAGTAHVRFARKSAGAWQVSQQISDVGALAGMPLVASDGAGNTWAVWSQANTEGTFNTWAAYCPAGGACGGASVIDDAAANTAVVDLAMSTSGVAIVLWSEGAGATARYWANVATGTSFGGSAPISPAGTLGGGSVALCGTGSGFVIWSQTDAALGRDDVWSVRYSGGAFAEPVRIEQSNATASAPRAVCDAVGNATAVWIQESQAVASVWSNRYRAGVGWREPRLVEEHTAIVEAVDLGGNADGRAVAWWIERVAAETVVHVWAGDVP